MSDYHELDNPIKEKKEKKGILQNFTTGIKNAPDTLFDDKDTKQKETKGIEKTLQNFSEEAPKTAVDGIVRGLVGFGSGIVNGVTGIVTEPMKEVKKRGAVGVLTGVGKGLTGLVTKPLAGVITLGSQTIQGVIFTPVTLVRQAGKLIYSEGDKQIEVETGKDPIFGIDHAESLKNATKVQIVHPAFTFINYIKSNGTDVRGIFRETGNVALVKDIINKYNAGKDADLKEAGIHEITGLLKAYIRMMPEPLFTFRLYRPILEIWRSENKDNCEAYSNLIKTIPFDNKTFLLLLFKMLEVIQDNAEVNMMTSSNLAIVFAPSLLRASPAEQLSMAAEMADIPDITAVVNFLIKNYKHIWA
eukprot:TRINITY_DN7714_c0_g1_i1.p1 TRINITY_DN7714_c0_g1~~TRINITY_DN7714_c0_g1_i1.p1  ORF type:complete len:359 (+),score=78.53 TRINITY_DN7714_c0_g1_i1:194-1270(+)